MSNETLKQRLMFIMDDLAERGMAADCAGRAVNEVFAGDEPQCIVFAAAEAIRAS